jgi:hypothetical protein
LRLCANFLVEQAEDDPTREQQTIDGALIGREHGVRRAAGRGLLRQYGAGAVPAHRSQELT